MALNSVEEIIEDIRQGKMVILMDDEDRENEGDLIMAAEAVTAEHINFMVRYARGLVCMPMSIERSERLGLKLMVERNRSGFGTKFTTSIEAATGVTTGISAADRARTIQVAAARHARAEDIVQPGHIFPLIAEPGGVLVRAGHTEAACDLARLAGFDATSVICEVLKDDGSMARRSDLETFAAEHGLKIGTIADLIHYRTMNETTVYRTNSYSLQTEQATFQVQVYQDRVQQCHHLALVLGQPEAERPLLVRVHQADTFRDLLDAKGEHAGWSARRALTEIAKAGEGVLVLLNGTQDANDLEVQLKHFLGLEKKARSSAKDGAGTYLTIGTGAQILRDLGVGKMRLLSSPIKFGALSGFGLEIVETLGADATAGE